MDEEKEISSSQEPNTSEEKTEGSSRRLILKSLAASGAVVAGQEVLPDSWSKPLVDSVILPAHAEMSAKVRTSDDDEAECSGDEDVEAPGENDGGVFDENDDEC